MNNLSKHILEKLKNIKLLVLDVDGTLTDGTVYYSSEGEAFKRFSIRDGMGIELLKKADIDIAIITTENSNIVNARASKLKINKVILGSRNKKKSLMELAEKYGYRLDEIAYIGDDVNDYYAMKQVGFAACPFDANPIIKEISDYISNKNGGDGAVRDVIEKILVSQNKSINLNENW